MILLLLLLLLLLVTAAWLLRVLLLLLLLWLLPAARWLLRVLLLLLTDTRISPILRHGGICQHLIPQLIAPLHAAAAHDDHTRQQCYGSSSGATAFC
jgi:hypothetical protein